ncbi:hypothetical protein GOP56_11240 [Brevibacillus sp. 7WMA2]|uniref:hypothetical protein n=1 Tax=Brevibacillus sp. 7WMA2 TaxID=2683193 RepID=UPI0013A7810C|nr:hypothetical protein [Brevibacillus sp. 7WMA2]QIC06132.1 hypothetical protein GOP56_11240 [Brevibacillus sp. 7WMA2]
MIDFKECPKKILNTEILIAQWGDYEIGSKTIFAEGDMVFVLGSAYQPEASRDEDGLLYIIYSDKVQGSVVVHESLLDEVAA